MYGDTSEPQLLQTTKRSGPLAMSSSIVCAAARRARRIFVSALRRGRLDDLAHELVEVAIGLVDDELARRAGPALEDVVDSLEVAGRSEVLGVVAQPLEQPGRERLGRDAGRVRQVDQLSVE